MKFPFRRSSTKEPVPAIEEGRLTHQLAPANGHAVQRHLAKVQRSIRLFCFVAGMFLLAVILPASPIRQALGYGGGSAFINPICGHPQQVFARLRPGATYSLPSTTELLHLPTPTKRPISDAYGATYDPRTNQLCVADATALDAHFGPATSTLPPAVTSTASGGLLTGSLVSSLLGSLWTSFEQWVRDSLQSLFSAFVSFGL
jgi:hypothetical protein